jgi:hypothetical protein
MHSGCHCNSGTNVGSRKWSKKIIYLFFSTCAEDITTKDLVISKLLGQNIEKYKSLFPHVCAAIQLRTDENGKMPPKAII